MANQHELAVLAMKRTGHHAVIHWLLSQVDGLCAHLNNCEFLRVERHVNPPPRVVSRTEREVLVAGFSSAFYVNGRFRGHVRHITPNEVFSSLRDRLLALQNVEWALRQAYEVEDLAAFLFNFEDMDLATFRSIRPVVSAREPAERRDVVVVVRDLGNFVASRLRGGYLVNDAVLAAWETHVRGALDAPSAPGTPDDPATTWVSFPRWHVDRAYREAVAARLGISFTDAGRDDVPPFGPPPAPGSSFDGLAQHGRASTMDVNGRQAAFVDDPAWRDACLRPRLRALSAEYFGFDVLDSSPTVPSP